MVTLVRTVITGANVVGGGVSTIAFTDPVDGTAAQGMTDAVRSFWTGLAAILDDNVVFQPESQMSRYAASNGELQQVFAVDGGAPIPGQNTGNSVPRASQALIRWATDDIVAGRIIRGRTFIPGMPVEAITDAGGVSTAYIADLEAAANVLISSSGGTVQIWHRPQGGTGGSEHLVTGASVWDQWAVLRGRRD